MATLRQESTKPMIASNPAQHNTTFYSFRYIFSTWKFILLIFLCFNNLQVASQDSLGLEKMFASLDTFDAERHSGEEFADAIVATIKVISNSDIPKSLNRIIKYVDALDHFSFDDDIKKRRAYMHAGYWFGELLSNYQISKKYMLKAHEVLTSKGLLYDDLTYYIENVLANTYTQHGDYESAIYFLKLAIEESNVNNNLNRIPRILTNLGIAYSSMGAPHRALETFEEGIRLADKYQIQKAQFNNRANIIEPLIELKDFELAQIYLQESKKYIVEDNIILWLDYAGQLSRAKKDYPQALKYFNEKLSLLQSTSANMQSREVAKLYNVMAETSLLAKDYIKTRKYLFNGIQAIAPNSESLFFDSNEIFRENAFYELSNTIGNYFVQLFDLTNNCLYLDSASITCEIALDANMRLKVDLLLDHSRLISIGDDRTINNRLIDINYRNVINCQQQKSDISGIFLRTKNTLLHESVTLKKMRESQTEEVKNNIKIRDDRIAFLKSKSIELETSEIKELQDLVRANQQLLNYHRSDSTNLITTPWIEFAITDEALYSIDNFTQQVRFQKLFSADSLHILLQEVRSTLFDISSAAKLNSVLSTCYNIILKKCEPLPQSFSIIPDNELNKIPFDLFVNSENKYLIEDQQITVRPSRFVFADDEQSLRKIHLIAPAYTSNALENTYDRGEAYPLHFVEKEIAAISDLYKTKKIYTSASDDTLRSVLSSEGVFHYSGHAREDEKKGRLILSAHDGKEINSISGERLSGWESNIDLAILSACETNAGTYRKGEGTMTLTRSFHEMGVPQVVSSLWTVNDQSTSAIMIDFHKKLRKGMHVGIALQKAKLNYLANAKGEKKHPYYWSGFILSSTIIPITNQSNSQAVLLIIFFSILSIWVTKKYIV